ncbi:NAD(P)H-binding protein [Staphylococcus massiliensis]|uniref:NAD(P)H-binding protein n=1 Tax=Staphylococcus massiliensis TaxID=555791 RepID=UPI001F42DB4E|nr:NAD(P)H-binding protein [Staphylococcus massiliensis]
MYVAKILLTEPETQLGYLLLQKLKQDYEVLAITNDVPLRPDEENVKWVQADLFSLREANQVLKDIDIGIYLVHSMTPNARLTQANFQDMDAMLADNFARASKRNGVKHIVYLSGLMPKHKILSKHLDSRRECEKILGSYGIPVTALRTGIIVGSNETSYSILENIVKRMPIIPLPKYAHNKTLPVAMEDVIDALNTIVNREADAHKIIDIGVKHHYTYKELFKITAQILKKKRIMFDMPIIPLWLSKFVISNIVPNDKATVYPLMDSLIHDMTRRPEHTEYPLSYGKLDLISSIMKTTSYQIKKVDLVKREAPKGVKSIQRFEIPTTYTMDDIALNYGRYLHAVTLSIVDSTIEEDCFTIRIPFLNIPIIVMAKDVEHSSPDRVLYYIKGGKLTNKKGIGNARLEFRRILDSNEVIIALQEFEPSLPWYVYKYTQALVHKIVMDLYRIYLNHWVNKHVETQTKTLDT